MARVSRDGLTAGLSLLCLALGCGQTAAPSLPATSTFVSLSFDDGLADQASVPQLLDAHGMKGTFFIISGRMGASGYLSQDQVRGLQADGHEVGAHTVDHLDLTKLTSTRQRQEICESRAALQELGLTVDSLAYPFGHYLPGTETDAAACGFSSARSVGGIDCGGCDPAERLPAQDLYALRTPDSIKPDTTLEEMESYVTTAEEHGGGWVVLVMHHVCEGCDPYSVRPAILSAFLDWLQPRSAHGTVVRTVGEMMGPGRALPPMPPPPTTLQNASLETDEDGDSVPDCWQEGGYGDNDAVWTRTADAHSGRWAEKLQVTRVVDGDRKLVVDQQDGSCAPVANPGHTNTVSAWYKSDQPVHLVAYQKDASGAWQYWAQSPTLPASGVYTQASWTTPPTPVGATRIGIGLSLRAVGTVVVDDFGLVGN